MTGYVHDEKKSAIYRVMNFKVLEKNNDLLTLKITSIRKSPQDNISDELFNKYFKVVSDDSIMYLNISSLKDGDYLISGTLGPYFICKSE
ncbi:FidL-like protein [Providencia manganoxydans]